MFFFLFFFYIFFKLFLLIFLNIKLVENLAILFFSLKYCGLLQYFPTWFFFFIFMIYFFSFQTGLCRFYFFSY